MPRDSAPSHLVIRVPATTANLGPGFDGLGMALQLYNDFKISFIERGPNRIEGRGTCAGLSGADNIFFGAMKRVCKLAGKPAPHAGVLVEGRIPVARGLGSSATAIVAGAMAANAWLGSPLAPDDLALAMAQAEGHPDNVAPAFFGGLTASVFTGDRLFTHVYPPHEAWRLVIFVPEYQLATAKARAAIPKQIPHRDAVFNLTRVPLVLDALLTGDAGLLRGVLADRLHEPYRKKLIRGYEAIKAAALAAGASAVYLSGAGPTMAAFCLGAKSANNVAAIAGERGKGAAKLPKLSAQILKPDSKGSVIRG